VARGRKAAEAVAEPAESEPTELETQTATDTQPNGGNAMTAAEIPTFEMPEDDTLPLELPDGDLKPLMFNHQAVRVVLSKPKIAKAKAGDFWGREGKDTFALEFGALYLRDDQPDHPELAELAGTRIPFVRFAIVPGEGSWDIAMAIFKAWGINPKRPDVSVLESVPAIARIVTKITQDDEGNDRPPRHNVYKLIRDAEFEKTLVGAQ